MLNICAGVTKVLSTNGDTHLGGEDFDNKLVDYCRKDFKEKSGHDIKDNPRAMRRLRTACEGAKMALSTSQSTPVEVDTLFEGEDYNTVINRQLFENLCKEHFEKCMPCVEKVLKDAKLSKNELNQIILVGGSTRIPKIQEMLVTFFNGKALNKGVHPDEAVA